MHAFLVLLIERLQNFLGNRFGKVDQQVGKVVNLHSLGRGNQLCRLHAFNQAIANLIGDLDKDITFDIRIDDFPEHCALFTRQGLQQSGNFGWMQAIDHRTRGAHAAAFQLLPQYLKIVLNVVSGVHAGGV